MGWRELEEVRLAVRDSAQDWPQERVQDRGVLRARLFRDYGI
jgi:hypothetical protein